MGFPDKNGLKRRKAKEAKIKMAYLLPLKGYTFILRLFLNSNICQTLTYQYFLLYFQHITQQENGVVSIPERMIMNIGESKIQKLCPLDKGYYLN